MSTLILGSRALLRSFMGKTVFLLGLASVLYSMFSNPSLETEGSASAGSEAVLSQFALAAPSESLREDARPTAGTATAVSDPLRSASLPEPALSASPSAPETTTEASASAQVQPEVQVQAEVQEMEGAPPFGQPGAPGAITGFEPDRSAGFAVESAARVDGAGSPSAGQSAGMTGTFSAFGSLYGSGTASAGVSGGGAGSSGLLSPQDLSWLSTSLKGFFQPQNLRVQGTLYPEGDGTSAPQAVTDFQISTTRWNLGDSLAPDSVLSISGPNQNNLSIVLSLNFISQGSTVPQRHSGSTGPVSIRVRTEYRNGRSFRVFELNLASFPIKQGDALRDVRLLLALDVSTPSAPVVSNESRLTFVRTGVKASAVAWPAPVNPAQDPYIIADEIPYSIDLQNAQ